MPRTTSSVCCTRRSDRRGAEACTARRSRIRAAVCGTELVPDAFVLSDEPDWRGAVEAEPPHASAAVGLRDRAGYRGRLHDLRHWHASQLLGRGRRRSSSPSGSVTATRRQRTGGTPTTMPAADLRAARAHRGGLDVARQRHRRGGSRIRLNVQPSAGTAWPAAAFGHFRLVDSSIGGTSPIERRFLGEEPADVPERRSGRTPDPETWQIG